MRASLGQSLASLCLCFGSLTACQAGTAPGATEASAKIAPQLAAAAQALAQGTTSLAHTDAQGRLQVYVYVSDTTPDTLGKLDQAGLAEPQVSTEMGLVQGWIAPRDLDALAALSCVKRISLPRYASPR